MIEQQMPPVSFMIMSPANGFERAIHLSHLIAFAVHVNRDRPMQLRAIVSGS